MVGGGPSRDQVAVFEKEARARTVPGNGNGYLRDT